MAAKLAADPSTITDAPGLGLSTSKMVVSYTNPRKPHVVTFFKNGKVTCDCVNNGTKNICAHALAVAEHKGSLKELVEWYNKTNQDVSLWNLVWSSGIPKHPGDKNNSRKRKRSRKVIPSPRSSSSLLPTCSKSCPIVKTNSTQILPSASSGQLHDTATSGSPLCLC